MRNAYGNYKKGKVLSRSVTTAEDYLERDVSYGLKAQ